MRRVAQFFRTVAAQRGLREDEVRWVQKHLSTQEEALFWQMSPIDQKHAVEVSRRAAALATAEGLTSPRELRVLIRAGLLHDIGKIGGDMTLWQRVAIVLVQRLSPKLARALAERGKEDLARGFLRSSWGARWRRAFYTQSVHAERGAAMAKMWGVEEEVLQLIRWHHQPQRGGRLLQLLSQADG